MPITQTPYVQLARRGLLFLLLYEHTVVDGTVLERLDGVARLVDEERLGAVAVAPEQDGPLPEVELHVEVRGWDVARGAGAGEAHHRDAA